MSEITILRDVVSKMDTVKATNDPFIEYTVKFYLGSEKDINVYLTQSDGNKYPLIYLLTPYTLRDGFEKTGEMIFVIAINNSIKDMPNTKRAEITFPILLELYEDFKKQLNFNNFVSINEEDITRTIYFGYKVSRNDKNEAIDIWDAMSIKIENIKFNFKNFNCNNYE